MQPNKNEFLFLFVHTESLDISQDEALKYEVFVGHLAYSVTEVHSVVTLF